MLFDARKITANDVIESEVCIIGAGPAGMTLAKELNGQDFRVCLLESGDINRTCQPTQSLAEGEIIGDLHANLIEARQRQFGGTANLWKDRTGNNHYSVRLLPLDKIDFEKRDWVPYSGWPFSKLHLDPYYERAEHLFRLRAAAYEGKDWEEQGKSQLPLASDRFKTSVYQFGPRNVFTHELPLELARSANITSFLNANAIELEANETAQSVTRVRAACLSGNQFYIEAKIFILATGGIENARLLLLSDRAQKGGLGNQNDLVGRFFMEHPSLKIGAIVPKHTQIFNSAKLYDLHWANNLLVMGKLSLSETMMHRHHLVNSGLILVPRPKAFNSPGVEALKNLKALPRMKFNEAVSCFGKTLRGAGDIGNYIFQKAFNSSAFAYSVSLGGWSSHKYNDRRFGMFEICASSEQVPNPNIRVTLSEERDRLGMRKTQPVSWKWNPIEIKSFVGLQKLLAEEVSQAGLGYFQPWIDFEAENIPTSTSQHHHLGTTRMHLDPKQGVVDQNCRVHGISNLFVAGSSVFPTGGYANPTLTIIALAIRLGDRVKQMMGERAVIAFSNRAKIRSE